MFRYLSAIGMSEYINKKKLRSFITQCLVSPELKTDLYTDPVTHQTSLECYIRMDQFGIVLRGTHSASSTSIDHVLPVVREFRNYMRLTDWNTENSEKSQPILYGCDAKFGTPVEIVLTHWHDALRLQPSSELKIGLCALSVSGQILLNVLRTEEDEEAYREEEQWRQEITRRIQKGDAEAEALLDEDTQLMEQDVCDRLQTEDVYTILEGLMIPADDSTLAYYNILGTITAIHKILNPYTEEWVYEFELDVMGTPYNIYINPKDLEGIPSVGMRFQGNAMLLGDVIVSED